MPEKPESTTLWALLESAARTQGESTALIFGNARQSYAQLRAHAHALAAGLRGLGVGRGDRVAIWLPNFPLWVALQFACARIGAIVVAINTRYRSDELGDVLGRSGAKLLVYAPGFRGINFTGIIEGVASASLCDLTHIIADGEGNGGAVPRVVCGIKVLAASSLALPEGDAGEHGGADDGCVMFTTSGTTSRPKLVLHTQRSVAQHALDSARALGYDVPGSVIKVVTPLCGVSGFGMPFAAVAARCPCVLTPAFDARESLDLIRAHRVTHIHANHEIIRRWLDTLTDADDVSSLKAVNCGSGIAGLYQRAAARGMPLQSIYGSSELQARFSRQRSDIAPERIVEAGGFPIATQAQVRAVDIDSGRILPHGEQGELQMRAPSQMHSYFGDAQATGHGLTEDGFVRSGDCGYTRADGSFVFEARIGDVLKLSGFMTSPAEIEGMILRYPGVLQCQVVGVQTGRGQRAVAFVRCADDFDEATLLRFCGEHIARYKVPARIIRLDAFPLTAGANAPKVQKIRLREIAQALGL